MQAFANYRHATHVLVWIMIGCFLLASNVSVVSAQQPYLPPSLIESEVKALDSFRKPLEEFSTRIGISKTQQKLNSQFSLLPVWKHHGLLHN